jgi:hypothetical protein
MDECCICFEDIAQPLYSTGRRLVCGHWFHAGCIAQWFERVGNSVCPYCRQAPSELEAYKHLVRALLIRWGTKHSEALLDGEHFGLVFDWSYRNRFNLGLEYRELNALPSDEFDCVARDVFVRLVQAGDFVQSDLGFVFQW